MSDTNNLVTFKFKAAINKQKTRVLFAEVGNDFLNLLFSFFILPLGTIMHVLEKHYGDKTPLVNGSLYTLYNAFVELGYWHFQSEDHHPPIFKGYWISGYKFPHLNANFETSALIYSLGKAYFAVYNIFKHDKASFIICDDLRLVPNIKGSIMMTLNNVGVDMADMDGCEMREVTFGLNEVMNFLKSLMISHQPLTDSILGKRVKSELQSSYSGISLHPIHTDETKEMVLKATLQASTKKFLFLQAEQDFVSFIFNLLKIPLGMVDMHLGGNTFFKNIGNMYKSIADILSDRNFLSFHTKGHLMDHLDVIVTHSSTMYMVTGDLTVTHLLVSSVFSLLNQMKIHSTDVEEMELRIGLEEARNILKASLISTSALSDVLITPLLKKQLEPKTSALSDALSDYFARGTK